jgi:hypothetical protein
VVDLSVDTSDLLKFARKMEDTAKTTGPIITTSLNEIGDQVLSLVATNLTKQSGLTLEQVRGMIKVKRASRNDLAYELTIQKELEEGDDVRKLEGKRESTDFGKRDPNDLVIIVTKDDDLVCMDCEELAAAGPMPLDVAKEHIPKHPHCRCVILPYVQKGKRLPVTMTSVTGTDPEKRMGRSIDVDMTLRQIVQDVISKSENKFKLTLK